MSNPIRTHLLLWTFYWFGLFTPVLASLIRRWSSFLNFLKEKKSHWFSDILLQICVLLLNNEGHNAPIWVNCSFQTPASVFLHNFRWWLKESKTWCFGNACCCLGLNPYLHRELFFTSLPCNYAAKCFRGRHGRRSGWSPNFLPPSSTSTGDVWFTVISIPPHQTTRMWEWGAASVSPCLTLIISALTFC